MSMFSASIFFPLNGHQQKEKSDGKSAKPQQEYDPRPSGGNDVLDECEVESDVDDYKKDQEVGTPQVIGPLIVSRQAEQSQAVASAIARNEPIVNQQSRASKKTHRSKHENVHKYSNLFCIHLFSFQAKLNWLS